jgi:hypothetical protein
LHGRKKKERFFSGLVCSAEMGELEFDNGTERRFLPEGFNP